MNSLLSISSAIVTAPDTQAAQQALGPATAAPAPVLPGAVAVQQVFAAAVAAPAGVAPHTRRTLSYHNHREVTDFLQLLDKHANELQDLDISGSDITADYFQRFPPLTELQKLDVSENAELSGDGFQHLIPLQHLRELDAHLCPNLTDNDIPQLAALVQLHRIDISYSGITRAGAEELQRRLPDVEVVWAPPL